MTSPCHCGQTSVTVSFLASTFTTNDTLPGCPWEDTTTREAAGEPDMETGSHFGVAAAQAARCGRYRAVRARRRWVADAQPRSAGIALSSALVAYEGRTAGQSVVQGASFGVEFLRHPVDRRGLHTIRFRIHSVYQGTADSASACCRIDEQVFEVTVVLQRPGGRMKHVMDEPDQAAVPFGDQAVGLHPLIHESRKGPVGNFDRDMLAIKTQVARPQCIPLHTVTRSHGSDLGHGTCLLFCINDGRAWLSPERPIIHDQRRLSDCVLYVGPPRTAADRYRAQNVWREKLRHVRG